MQMLDESFRQLMKDKAHMSVQEFNSNLNELNSARADTITNLNSETRMQDILTKRAAEGSFSTETSSSLSKRSHEGDNFGESSSKRS